MMLFFELGVDGRNKVKLTLSLRELEGVMEMSNVRPDPVFAVANKRGLQHGCTH
jgi:hypothetical protein